MAKAIDFYFDFSSPYGYLASTQIDDLAKRHNREVAWHPFLLGAAFKVTGQKPLVEQPLRITAVTIHDGGGLQVTVSGEVGLSYGLEASSDLVHWTKVEVQDNTTGSLEFHDEPATNAIRFYRAVSMPE